MDRLTVRQGKRRKRRQARQRQYHAAVGARAKILERQWTKEFLARLAREP